MWNYVGSADYYGVVRIWNQPGYRNKGKGKAGDGQDIRKEKDSPEPVRAVFYGKSRIDD